MRRTRPFATLFAVTLLSACAGTQPPPPAPPLPEPGPPAPAETDPGFDFDLIIENGRIVDGTGSAWFYGDVAVKDGRIARVTPGGLLRGATASERVDAAGHVVSPGFIDIQSQSRYALLSGDSRVISKVTQGITTEIMGEGTTTAPINPAHLNPLRDDPSEADRQAWLFSGERGFDQWLRAMEARGTSVNQGSFLGGGTLRAYAVGSRMGEASPAELDTMKAVVRRAMEDGAFGVATALIYVPGNFASTEELAEVAAAMAPYGGVYITHLRSEANNLLEAIDEAIEIGIRGKVPVEIFHLKAGGRENWPKTAQAIMKIDSARTAGVDVQANMYPYVAGSTGLTSCFPPSASANGRLFRNLADVAGRARIRAEIENQTEDWENLCALSKPSAPSRLRQCGKSTEVLWPISGRRRSGVRKGLDRDRHGPGPRRAPKNRHRLLHDERGQRSAPDQAAVDEVRYRCGGGGSADHHGSDSPEVVRHLHPDPRPVRQRAGRRVPRRRHQEDVFSGRDTVVDYGSRCDP